MNTPALIPALLFLATLLIIGLWCGRRVSRAADFEREFMIGGGRLGGVVLAMTLVATYSSVSSFVSGPGVAWQLGYGWNVIEDAKATIRDTIREVRERHNPDLEILGILLNRCNMRLLLNREVAEMSQDIARSLGTRVFKTQIHTSVSVAESPAHGESVITHAPSSKPARDFKALLNELMRLE
mgnify:CR=1 FL=1